MKDDFEDFGENNNEEIETEDFEEEAQVTESKKKEPEKPLVKTQSSKPKTAMISIKTEELDDFLAEVNRLSTIIENTAADMTKIERSTAVVEKLEKISNMDLSDFRSKFDDLLRNLDLAKEVKESMRDVLLNVESEYKSLVHEYKTSNDQLKNLIFELEKKYIPVEKPKMKLWKKLVIGSLLIMAVAAGVIGYLQYNTISNSSSNSKPNTKALKYRIEIPYATIVTKVNTGKQVTTKQTYKTEAVLKNNGFFYFRDRENGEWKVYKAFINILKKG
jgi:hypothetical protein